MNARPGRLSHGEESAANRGRYGFSAGLRAEPHEERLQADVDLMLTRAKWMGDFIERDTAGQTLQHRTLGRRKSVSTEYGQSATPGMRDERTP